MSNDPNEPQQWLTSSEPVPQPQQVTQQQQWPNLPKNVKRDAWGNPVIKDNGKPKKKKKIFIWFFLAVQVIMLIWVITGAATGSGNTSDAENAGTAIGVGLVVIIWVIVDFLLGVGYGIYKLATK